MKKIISLIVCLLLLAGIIAGASAIYNNYMEENKPSNIIMIGGKGDRTDTESEAADTESEAADTESEAADTESEAADTESEAADTESEAADTESEAADTESEAADTESEAADTESEAADTETETETEYVSPYLAPDFTVYDIDGKPVKLSDFKGSPIVLNFWASDCYYCVREMPDFQKMYEKYGDKVVFLMVCHVGFANRTPTHEQSFIDKQGYTFPVVFDTRYDAVSTYGISGIPHTYFIDRSFDLYTHIPGMADAEALETCIGWILE